MKTLISVVMLGACAALGACSDAEDGLGPIAPSLSSPYAGEMHVTSPQAGSVMRASSTFTLAAEQEVRTSPGQGRAQVQVSTDDGSSWTSLGEFPWSAQSTYLEYGPLTLSGVGVARLRVVVYDEGPEAPFLVSSEIAVRCVRHLLAQADL